MEVGGGRGRRRLSSREASPDRARLAYSHQQQPPPPPQQQQQRFARPLRKLQVVYYLCRNGQLEHPHFIELPYLPNHQPRLKDVIERLSLLRGKGMPSLFSWSCKRSYKNGYVWNDLADNDVIYPADGVEYVLKGSEIFPGIYDRFQHLPASSRQPKALPASRKLRLEFDDDEVEGVEDEATEEEWMGSKLTIGGKMPVGYSRLTRGVSKEEMERVDGQGPTPGDSPPRANRASPRRFILSIVLLLGQAPNRAYPAAVAGGDDSGYSAPELGLSRNSVLLQFIACGSAALKGRSTPSSGAVKAAAAAANSASEAAASSGGCRSCPITGLHRGALSRLAGRAADDESRCYSEHPRYCHPLVEDKEYFSGSIVERSKGGGPPEPVLQKSSSYKEERSSKLGIVEDEERAAGKEARGKCIPGRRRCSAKQLQ